MPKKIDEFRCLLISPSDVASEREAVLATVVKWNAHIGQALQARIELVLWETHSVPESSARPQQSLNRQIVDDADFAVAIFWARLGTPTGTSISGSAEEIQRLLDKGVRVLPYFGTGP